MYLAGYTMQEIAEAVGIDKANISREIENLLQISSLAKSQQLHASFQDSEFETPIYNVWSFAKKTNNVSHHGVQINRHNEPESREHPGIVCADPLPHSWS